MSYEPSSAQRCNEDVLREITSYVDSKVDLAHTALVRKSWLQPSRINLYRDVFLSRSQAHESCPLSSTLMEKHYLAQLVRAITLDADYLSDKKTAKSRRALLASPHMRDVRRLHVYWDKLLTRLDLFREFSFRENIRWLELFGTKDTEELNMDQVLVAFPRLRKFRVIHCPRLNFRPAHVPQQVPLHPTLPRLTALSLKVTSYSPDIANLFILVNESLEHFNLCISNTPTSMPELVDAFKQHGSHLRYFCLDSSRYPKPLLDGLVQHLPNLTSMRGGYGTYSFAMFGNLPASIRMLDFYGCNRTCFPIHDIIALLGDRRRRPVHLFKMILRFDLPIASEIKCVAEEACQKVGVELSWKRDRLENDPYF